MKAVMVMNGRCWWRLVNSGEGKKKKKKKN